MRAPQPSMGKPGQGLIVSGDPQHACLHGRKRRAETLACDTAKNRTHQGESDMDGHTSGTTPGLQPEGGRVVGVRGSCRVRVHG